MRAALRTLGLTCCLAAFVVIGGGHWAVLQSVAWAQMLVDYTHGTGSLRQGIVKTFDGAHPCELCQKISAGIERESRDARQKPFGDELLRKLKLTAVLPTTIFAPLAREGERLPALVVSPAGRLADAPPVPPPRAA